MPSVQNRAVWRPIAWYRDFHDVPRVVCVAAAGGCLLFDSRFDDAHDDYAPSYEIRFVPLPADDADAVLAAASSCAVVGEMPVNAEAFDASRRREILVPQALAPRL